MSTSGASVNDTGMVILTIVCALVIVVILYGGPSEVIYTIETLMRGALDAIRRMVGSVRG